MVVQMIVAGKDTSELDLILLRVADYYEGEIVGAILIAMYLPMFDLVNVVKGGG